MVQCYINGNESNSKKKARDVKECVPNARDSQYTRKNCYTLPVKDKTSFKQGGKTMESFKPPNTHHV